MITKILISIITGCLVASAQNNDLNAKGVDAINRGDFLNGITYLERAYDQNKTHSGIQINLLNSYIKYSSELLQKKELDLSLRYADKALRVIGISEASRNNLSRIYYNIAVSYYQQKNYSVAEALLNKSDQLLPAQVPVLVLQGHIAYSKQQLAKAEISWKKALQLDPSNDEIKKLLTVLSKQSASETMLSSMESGEIFDIHYDRGSVGNEIFEIKQHLMECYREFGLEFGHYPSHPIVVILYSESEFRSTLNVRSQVAGLYDGKIRLPVNFKKYSLSDLKKTIRHEYAHAIIHDMAGNTCPIWLHEGLAVYSEKGSPGSDIALIKAALQKKLVLTFETLSNAHTWNRSDLAPLAYSQSYGIVNYMIHRWNMQVVCEFLKNIKSGQSFESVLLSTTNSTIQELDRSWKASIEY